MTLVGASIGPALLAAGCLLLLVAGASDFATRRVPNGVSATLAGIGVVLHLSSGDLAAALGAAFAVFLLGVLCWRRGWLGGGDVKLLAATALLVAPWRVPGLLAAIALAGGVLALAYLLLRFVLTMSRRHRPGELRLGEHATRTATLSRIIRIEHWRIRRGAPLPYASAICVGASFMLLTH